MPTTKEYTIYTFEELSDRAKERARDWWREGGLDYDWWDAVYEDAKNMGKLLGFDISKIYFSGFWSQGDGACFESSFQYAKGAAAAIAAETGGSETALIDIANRLQEMQRKEFYSISGTTRHRGHYHHEYCMDISFTTRQGDEPATVHDVLKEIVADFARWIYRQLEKEHEYLTSDEAVEETIIANEYTFTEEGKRED